EIDLAEPTPSLYENVISLETIEHVPNPYRFMELLIDKMSPNGQLIVSIPTETQHGSHLNPLHFSNWNYKRLMNFLEQYFENITVFKQQLAFLSPTLFEISEIYDRPPNEDRDEDFIAILRAPRKHKRPNIVLKRQMALGDVIWITPILRSLRCLYPNHNLLVMTARTEVFSKNPDADLVFNMQYEPLPDDVIIDLDWAYEKRRNLHILHAYAETSGIPLSFTTPSLYPTSGEVRLVANTLLRNFQRQGIERLIAVHMQATTPDRIWPKSHWQRFIADLLRQDKKLGVIILGHGRDYSAVDTGFSTNHHILCLARQLSLMHTAAALSLCDLLIAPDSGLLHVAAAVGTPYLGLFSMADPATRLPFATGSRALWSDIECRGCLREIPATNAVLCPLGHASCMERILPEKVLTMTVQMLEAAIPGRWETRCQMLFLDEINVDAGQQSISATRVPKSPFQQGIQAFNRKDHKTAIEYFSTAMSQEPDNPLPCAYLAFICARQGLVQEACHFIAQAEKIAPERADLIAILGETFLENQRPAEAVEFLRAALQIQPDMAEAYPAFAQALHLTGQSEEAISHLKISAALSSDVKSSIQSTLLQILAECGDLAEFTKYALRFSRGLPDDLLAAHCLARCDEDGERFLETLYRIQDRLKDIIGNAPENTHARKGAPARIAFMLGDFTSPHQLEQLFALLCHLPTENFFTALVSCYTNPPKDDIFQKCSLLADAFLPIHQDEDDSAVEKIRALAPDILINMEVLAPPERLTVFLATPAAHKLLWGEAPIPPIAPDVRTLAGARLGVENMLPSICLPELGEVLDLPELPLTGEAARSKPPVLGCLIPAAEIARSGWQLFAETLRGLPDATLVINLDELGQAAQNFISGQFSSLGIDPAQLVFANVRTAEEYCLAWQAIDLGLLPPVNPGGLALPTCLWMGRPCLVPASSLPWSQRPAAFLAALGKEKWIADDAPRYAELARQLATPGRKPDPALRERMKALGLTEAKGFALGFAEAMSNLSCPILPGEQA
ncbi:MAG: hypothetical protein FWF17_01420, partial [Betaproteobacteria bacterium]|nr:hypothetical protein [Betaproteobacteria bacterium]